MKKREEFKVEASGQRLDQFLAERFREFSRTYFRTLIDGGGVLVGGIVGRPDQHLREGERVEVEMSRSGWADASDFEKWVIHEDDWLMVLNKPSGLLMHPLGESWLSVPAAALSEPHPNLAGLLQCARPAIIKAGVARCGIVHRLDRQTSGVLLVAKKPQAYDALITAFKERLVTKVYRAVVRGHLERQSTQVEAPIGRKPGHRKVTVTPFGKEAQTQFLVVEQAKSCALVEGRPRTGRTHQIRAHLALIGHPVAGDPEFEKPSDLPKAPRLMLHAYEIEFSHPKTGRPVSFRAPFPADLRAFWALCRGKKR